MSSSVGKGGGAAATHAPPPPPAPPPPHAQHDHHHEPQRRSSDGAAGGGDDLNLEALQALKRVFDAADDDGSGELDLERWCARVGPHLGARVGRRQAAELFLKIDADCGGTVSWDEFAQYMLLERQQRAAGGGGGGGGDGDGGGGAAEHYRLFPEPPPAAAAHGGAGGAGSGGNGGGGGRAAAHRDGVLALRVVPQLDRVVTCGRDGSFRLWGASDLRHSRTVANGPGWVTDCLFLPQSRRVVVSSLDGAISTYDTNR